MSKERRQKLFDDYPILFEKRNEQPGCRPYPIRWGLEHGDGWLPLVEDLCASIQKYVEQKQKEDPNARQVQVVQVKEKFGSLRFYIDGGDDCIYGLIALAERISARTCEDCGNHGTLRTNGWWRVRCEPCEANRAEKWKQNERSQLES